MSGRKRDAAAAPVLGVDGGNTKTIAVVAAPDGSMLAAVRGRCTDIYGVDGPAAALAELVRIVREVCGAAGVEPRDAHSTAFCLAGADWPKDYDLLRSELTRQAGLVRPLVFNDAFGSLYAGSAQGVGVGVACGTYLAIGARSAQGETWHSSFWSDPGGAHGLGSAAVRAVYRAELGLESQTSLSEAVVRIYGVRSATELLHSFTRREYPVPELEVVRAARVLLDEADRGDEVARRLVRETGARAGECSVAAARRVGLAGSFPLVLAGGVFGHGSPLLAEAIAAPVLAAFPEARVVRPRLPPIGGALGIALGSLPPPELARARARIEETLPADLMPSNPSVVNSSSLARSVC